MAMDGTVISTPADIAALAKGLSEGERAFLLDVIAGRKLPLASREQDRARQRVRRMGLVKVVQNPRRWVATELGTQAAHILGDTPHG